MKRGLNESKAQATAPRATIVEVAAAAGVSIKTVSRVVNR
ncbi:MAG: LacI family DNA-binding transcriptional regulator, partial [Pseudomonadales bacterium]